jgi:hypothetical protein
LTAKLKLSTFTPSERCTAYVTSALHTAADAASRHYGNRRAIIMGINEDYEESTRTDSASDRSDYLKCHEKKMHVVKSYDSFNDFRFVMLIIRYRTLQFEQPIIPPRNI